MTHLDREVLMFVTQDGTLTIGAPLYADEERPSCDPGYGSRWAQAVRDAALDAFMEDRPERAREIMARQFEPVEMGREAISLPVFSTNTTAQACILRTRFCRLAYDKLPNGERRYVLKDFDGSLDALKLMGREMAKFYTRMER